MIGETISHVVPASFPAPGSAQAWWISSPRRRRHGATGDGASTANCRVPPTYGERRFGYRSTMTDDDRDLPTTNHPLHGEKRSMTGPAIIVPLILLAALAVIALLIWLT